MDEQTATIIVTVGLIALGIFLIVKIYRIIQRGFYKLASIYIAITASSGGGLTYLLTNFNGS